MSDTIIVALIGFFGTLIGSGLGVVTSIKLTTYRLEQLEKKVEKHNNIVERTYNLERKESITEEKIEMIEDCLLAIRDYLQK
jgi:ABC-type lipoprotein release transport system permease subunit